VIIKLKSWIKRYLPAEVAGTITAITCATIVYIITKNEIITALAGTWGENIGFYGVMITRDIASAKRLHKSKRKRYTVTSFFKTLRDIILEFGPAELLDTLLVRPTMMYLFPKLLNNIQLGVFAGKIAADIIFYLPTIISYELQQIYRKKKK
jgi:hypothetical protein